METRVFTCIRCPMGCELTATINDNGMVTVKGNACIRGEQYARKELTNPLRALTTTVRVVGGTQAMVPVRTKGDIPKEKIMDGIRQLKQIQVTAPIQIGEVIVENLVNTGVAVIA
ncbi:MAG TPA: molybdopterin oxidoreductase, partial [Lachnoclostridium phytofermentans]